MSCIGIVSTFLIYDILYDWYNCPHWLHTAPILLPEAALDALAHMKEPSARVIKTGERKKQ